MSNTPISNLREALRLSPNNFVLWYMLADALLEDKRYDESEVEYSAILQKTGEPRARLGLANTYFNKGNYSACIVILEDAIDNQDASAPLFTLYAKAHLKEGDHQKAMDAYQEAMKMDTNHRDEELDNALRLTTDLDVNEEKLHDKVADRFLQKPEINFSNVGGMQSVKKEIELKIIRPSMHPELYSAYGKKIGGGILLYGPPGCGKTYISKATAGQVNAKFISIGLNDILDMWLGNSEKNLHEVFELARANTPCVLFIDEIDALGANRSDMRQSAGRQVINQFLQEMDGITNDNQGILIIGATNTPWYIDPAFRRPGRFDRIIFVPPPDQQSRDSIFRIKLEDKPTLSIDTEDLALRTNLYSGADIDAVIDIAIEQKLESSFEDGILKPIVTRDLIAAINKHKPSTREWFSAAKNFALFANDTGLYDDILSYMKSNRI